MIKAKKSLRYANRRPTHPGAVLREDVLPQLGITQTSFALHLGVSRLTVSEILLEKRGISAEMAIRLSKVIGGSPQTWLRMQEALDLWEAEQKLKTQGNNKLTPIKLLAA